MLELVLSVAQALLGSIPWKDLPVVGLVLAWLAGSVLRIRRGHVAASMARGGVRVGPKAMYASLGTGVMELLWMAGGERPRDLSEVSGFADGSEALLREALQRGRGVVLGASHTGNWELAACALAETVPLSVLVKRVTIGGFERFLWRLRERYGVGLLHGEGALADARRQVEGGRVVAMLIDQVPGLEEHGEWVPFLGAEALTDRSPAALAASTGAPFVVTTSRRAEEGRHLLHVLSVKWPPPRGRRQWTRRVTLEATSELEAFVRGYPDQWLWLHKRWKRPVLGAGERKEQGMGMGNRG